MRINHDYIKQLIDIALDHPAPTFTIRDFEAAGVPYETPEFEFHMKLLDDQRLIEQDDGDSGFGLEKGVDGFSSWAVLPLRLTARGHDFAEAISEKTIWDKIKKELPGAAMTTLVGMSLELTKDYAKQALGLS